jgi:hypothetical protein
MDAKTTYENTVARLEPDICMIDTNAALASIAISLKRIADSLEKANLDGTQLTLCIQEGIWNGLRYGK